MKKVKERAKPKTDHIRRNEEKILQLYKHGAIDADVTNTLKINPETYKKYLRNNRDFYDKIWELKFEFDVEVVEESLKKRANGFEYEEVHTEVNEDKNGQQRKSVKRIKKFIPPDTTAMIFILKNRNSKKWRDKQEVDVTVVDLSKAIENLDNAIGANKTSG